MYTQRQNDSSSLGKFSGNGGHLKDILLGLVDYKPDALIRSIISALNHSPIIIINLEHNRSFNGYHESLASSRITSEVSQGDAWV